MRLYFLRHGPAESRADWTGDDRERPLSDDGRKAVRREVAGLKALGLGIDIIVTSPLSRARETAEIVADGLDMTDRVVEDERLAHGFDAGDARAIVAEHGRDATVMLVGHEPDFSNTMAALTGGGSYVIKKGGLARVDAADPSLAGAMLVWLLPPKALLAPKGSEA